MGIAVFVGYLSTMKAEKKTIAVHDESGFFFNEFKNTDEYHYLDASKIDLSVLKDSIIKESYEGLLAIPKNDGSEKWQSKIEYISNDSPSVTFIEDIEDIINQKLTAQNYIQNHLDTLAITKSKSDVSIHLQKATGEEALKGLNEIKIAIGGAFGYLIMMYRYLWKYGHAKRY